MENKAHLQHPLLRPIGGTVKGKVVFITGANRGIGKAFVESFLEHGASKVYAAVRNIESAEIAFQDQLRLQKNNEDNDVGVIVPVRLDMSDPESIKETATIATDVDIVINNAGVLTRTTPLEGETAIENLQYEMNVNVYGLMRLAHAFAPMLERRNGTGLFVQINSVSSMRCAAINVSTYSASKSAAFSISQALRHELGAKGVHVVSVHPGPIGTDMVADIPAMISIAPPPSTVAESLIDAITTTSSSSDDEDGERPSFPPFLLFPDEKAKGLGKAYQSFAEVVIEQGNSYGEEGRL